MIQLHVWKFNFYGTRNAYAADFKIFISHEWMEDIINQRLEK